MVGHFSHLPAFAPARTGWFEWMCRFGWLSMQGQAACPGIGKLEQSGLQVVLPGQPNLGGALCNSVLPSVKCCCSFRPGGGGGGLNFNHVATLSRLCRDIA